MGREFWSDKEENEDKEKEKESIRSSKVQRNQWKLNMNINFYTSTYSTSQIASQRY